MATPSQIFYRPVLNISCCEYQKKFLCHQGFNLLNRGDKTRNDFTFGIVTLVTIWFPGIFAAIHWISENRLNKSKSIPRVVLEACKWFENPSFYVNKHAEMEQAPFTFTNTFLTVGLLIFWPVVPFISFLNLLWHRPKNYKRKESVESDNTDEFIHAKNIASMASGVSGGIESPIQFVLQVTIKYIFSRNCSYYWKMQFISLIVLFDPEWIPSVPLVCF